MKKLKVELANCHGIRQLSAVISFDKGNASAIYAPNGLMKTSFARTFGDLAAGESSSDHLFPDRPNERVITDDDDVALRPEQVVVIVSYDEEMGPTAETSTLLVDKVLRDEYEGLERNINQAKSDLVAALKATAGTRKDVERTVSLAIMRDDESFFPALIRVEEELVDDPAKYADVPYDTIFDDKVVTLLRTDDFRNALAKYIQQLNDLLDESAYFSRETFNYYNAETIAKALGANGFFDASHSVVLNSGDGSEKLSSLEDLTAVIEAEKSRITDDPALRKTFASLESKLTRNAECRKFLAYISENESLLPELANIDRFNERVWKSYLKVNEHHYKFAVDRYRGAAERRKAIRAAAEEQRGQWEDVIDMFNDRFFVPFTLTAKNRTSVVLGLEPVAKLGFEFEDGADRVAVERESLLEVLSTGEKKALYILNVLFEVERRKNSSDETLFIVDDIADSFDYKNKYAIIQYLKDISEIDSFRLIVLTHNFDFYRTLESRFIPRKQCLMAQRSEEGVSLVDAVGIRNPFIKIFKPGFFDDPVKRIAAVPFMRNLIEYTKGYDNPGYVRLTSLLHWKPETASVTQSDLDEVFCSLFGGTDAWPDPASPVVDMVEEEADRCSGIAASMDLANKITLSIAIRLAAERYMITEIGDDDFVNGLQANQTSGLFSRFKKDFPTRTAIVRTLDAVVLMTPEHIHVNSFMYEPILDMSEEHLSRLLSEVRALA
ncbi:phage infection protein [Mycobacterium sp. 1245852.3]|uniref:phage infection protein n=1 Tax=Mycobacterium sp. 1245852.3 TaxID=1856860 RepID=UPI000800E6E3|nr:phage infection protein [Mycobacterium sp. 1245852.3]OBJ93996.1 phage infection protein [Mycobacterium sp. 1245852.3]